MLDVRAAGPFLAAILDDPADDARRLVFADWLDDHGDAARAEFIRVQVERATVWDDAGHRAALLDRERTLLAGHARTWLGPVMNLATLWRFERGLPRVTVNAGTVLAVLNNAETTAAFGRAGVQHLHLSGVRSNLSTVARWPVLRQLHTLDLDGNGLEDAEVLAFLHAVRLPALRTLGLANNRLTDEIIAQVCSQDHWPRRLDLRNNLLTGKSVSDIEFTRAFRSRSEIYADLTGNVGVDVARIEFCREPADELLPGMPRRVVNSLGMEFVLCPAGRFLMDADGLSPKHPWTIAQPFYLSVYSVTQSQWEAVGLENPIHPMSELGHGPTRPVHMLSLDDILDLVERLNAWPAEVAAGRSFRLPSDAEWEYARRADTTTNYWWGDHFREEMADDDLQEALPIGRYPPNPFGLFDMDGCIGEATLDNPLGSWPFVEGGVRLVLILAPPPPSPPENR